MAPIAEAAAVCLPLRQQAMSPEEAERLADALKVIAHPARLRLLSLIAACPDSEACSSESSAALGSSTAPFQTVSGRCSSCSASSRAPLFVVLVTISAAN